MTAEEVGQFRDRACGVAQELFVLHGYREVGLRAIASELGVTATALYRYFPDGRDEILAAVRARAFSRFSEVCETALSSSTNPMTRFRAMGAVHMKFAMEETSAYHMMFDVFQSADFDELREQARRSRRILFEAFEDFVASGIVAGDPRLAAHVYWAAMHGAALLYTSQQLRLGIDIEDLMDAIRGMIIGNQARSPAEVADVGQ